MLLEPLVSTIETLKERISTHSLTLRENETRTRMALIDPLLKALGWDTSDPALVAPEYDVSGRKADYALLGGDGSPSATVEAKKLGEPLGPHRMQMLNYSNASDVEYAGLTDGDQWELYEVFKRGQLEERRILDVSIANTPTHEAALKLLVLWRSNLTSGQTVAANAPVLLALTQATRSEPNLQPTNAPSVSTPPLQDSELSSHAADDTDWRPLSGINYKKGDSKPIGIKFSDASSIETSGGWTDAWFQVCEWLASTGRLTELHCPIRISNGASRYLVHTKPIHSNGREFGQERKTTTGLSVERQYGPKQVLGNARFLLGKFKVPVDTVELQFE